MKKCFLFHLSILLSLRLNAETVPQTERILELSSKRLRRVPAIELKEEDPGAPAASPKKLQRQQVQPKSSGNLDAELKRRHAPVESSQSVIVNPQKPKAEIPIRAGDIVDAFVGQDLIGYESSESPVKAIVSSGQFKGSILIGNCRLDQKTKRLLVGFYRLRLPDGRETPIEGVLQSEGGALGLQGEFRSEYWRFFWAETLTRSVSGYAESLTDRDRSLAFGYQPRPGLENSARQGVAIGTRAAADALGERARTAPEYTVKEGPSRVRIFVTKGPDDI